MLTHDAIIKLIDELETLLRTTFIDLPAARDLGLWWSGAEDSPIVEDTALDRELFWLSYAHKEYEARVIILNIRNLARIELLNAANEQTL